MAAGAAQPALVGSRAPPPAADRRARTCASAPPRGDEKGEGEGDTAPRPRSPASRRRACACAATGRGRGRRRQGAGGGRAAPSLRRRAAGLRAGRTLGGRAGRRGSALPLPSLPSAHRRPTFALLASPPSQLRLPLPLSPSLLSLPLCFSLAHGWAGESRTEGDKLPLAMSVPLSTFCESGSQGIEREVQPVHRSVYGYMETVPVSLGSGLHPIYHPPAVD